MKLIPVDPANEVHLKVLYDLLAERTPEQSISHKRMPTWEEHVSHVAAKASRTSEVAHLEWAMVCAQYPEEGRALFQDTLIGAVYLSHLNEIGINILARFRRAGHAYEAVRTLITKHGTRRYLWNVNPANAASVALARKLGFGGPIQHTYSLEVI